MQYEQLSIYHYLDYEDDELYKRISNLKIGEEMFFNQTKISRYAEHFEVENDMYHEPIKTVKECYEWLLIKRISIKETV